VAFKGEFLGSQERIFGHLIKNLDIIENAKSAQVLEGGTGRLGINYASLTWDMNEGRPVERNTKTKVRPPKEKTCGGKKGRKKGSLEEEKGTRKTIGKRTFQKHKGPLLCGK